jgi:hypothetical protein
LRGLSGKSFGFLQNCRDTAENLLASRELQEHSGKSYGLPAKLRGHGGKSFGFLQRKLMWRRWD